MSLVRLLQICRNWHELINGPVSISFVPSDTSSFDTASPVPNRVAIGTTNSGTITVTGGISAVPEPSSLAMRCTAVLMGLGYARPCRGRPGPRLREPRVR
jgi:hypothetical protein